MSESARRPLRGPDTKARRARMNKRGRCRRTARLDKSMSRLCFMKKSAPRMGLETSAKVKECTGLKAPKSRFKVQEPKVSMVDPLAARRAPEGRDANTAWEAG